MFLVSKFFITQTLSIHILCVQKSFCLLYVDYWIDESVYGPWLNLWKDFPICNGKTFPISTLRSCNFWVHGKILDRLKNPQGPGLIPIQRVEDQRDWIEELDLGLRDFLIYLSFFWWMHIEIRYMENFNFQNCSIKVKNSMI